MTRCALVLLVVAAALPQDPPPPVPGAQDPALNRLADRCGSQIPWERDLEKALSKAEDAGRLVFAYVYDRSRSSKFGNGFKDDFMKAGPFIDIDLVWTVSRKFVPLRLNLTSSACGDLAIDDKDGERPLKLNDVTVPGFLFITPKGKVVRKFDSIAVASSELVFHVAHAVLAANPDFDKPGDGLAEAREAVDADPEDARIRYKLGLELMKDAEFERAIETFAEVVQRAPDDRDAVESLYRTAIANRRLRRPAKALQAIRAARKLNENVGAKFEGDMMLEEALLELRQGRATEAEKLLTSALKDWPRSNRAPEMSFTLGALLFLDDRENDARETWRALAKSNPESPWAWKAAAELLLRGPFTNGWEDFEWLPEDLLTGQSSSSERPRDPSQRLQAMHEGLDYLLRKQRANGCWINVKGQFDFKESITILAAHALWECRDYRPEENRKAREKALKFYEAWLDRGASPKGMGIWPWVVGYTAYIRMATGSKGEEREHYLKMADRCLKGFLPAQLKDGNFTYIGPPTSFITAQPLVASRWLKDMGGEFDAKFVEKGLEGLVTMKEPERQTYWYTHSASDEFDHGAPEGAAGRGAICYLAEYLWEKCDHDKLTWAGQMFIDHRIRLKNVRKATDWHAGKYANAPYFFFYDYYWMTELIQHMKPEKRKEWAKAITADLLEIGEIDGSWLDWHIGGKGYGTAMAVLCLKNCERAE